MRAVPAGSLKPPQNDLGRFFNGKHSKGVFPPLAKKEVLRTTKSTQ
jgi:hypothetical protein